MVFKEFNSRIRFLVCTLILLLCITVPLILYGNGSIDHYSVKHTAASLKIIEDGRLNFNEKWEYVYLFNQIPAYYVMMSEILLITNISFKSLVFTPILLVPYIFTFFSLVYILSNKNGLLSSVLTFIIIISGSNGTQKVFIWPHGFGEIISFSFLILLSIMLKKSNKNSSHVIVLLLLLACIEYISYDESFIMISEILWIIILGLFSYPLLKKLKFSTILSFCIVLYFGLNKFIYSMFLPAVAKKFDDAQDGVYLSVFERFSKYFLGGDVNDPLNPYFLSYPKSLTYVYTVKYIILFLVLSFALYLVLYRSRKFSNHLHLIFIIYFLGTATYAFPRVLLGQVIISRFFFPFIISLPLIYTIYSKRNSINPVYIICVFLLLTTISSSYILNSNNLVQKDYNGYGYLEDTSLWLEHKAPASSSIISDQLTYGWLFTYKTYYNSMCPSEKNLKYGIFRNDHLMGVFFHENNMLADFFIMNYKLHYIQMSSWRILKPFSNSKKLIESNPSLLKIYTSSSEISIYHPRDSKYISN